MRNFLSPEKMTKKVTKFLREKVQHKHQYQVKPGGCQFFLKTRSHSDLIEGGIKYWKVTTMNKCQGAKKAKIIVWPELADIA